MNQKFNHGDLVRIAKDLGSAMSHFTSGCNAIVIGSYADKYGGSDSKSYTLFIKGEGETSWYDESQLTFIRYAPDLLTKWKIQEEKRLKQLSNWNWIKANWKKIRTRPSSVTILKIFEKFDIKTSFHGNGEFFVLARDWERNFPEIDRQMKELIK